MVEDTSSASPDAQAPLTISVTPAAQARPVLTLLFQSIPLPDRTEVVDAQLQAVAGDTSEVEGLLRADRGGRLVGAAWGRRSPGKSALIFPPELALGEAEQTSELMLARISRMTSSGVEVRLMVL